MRKLLIYIVLAAIPAIFNACAPSYTRSQPAPRSFDRPQRPSDNHVWREGDWVWRRQSRSYTHKNGYWAKPRNGRTYRQGHWNTTRRGQYWVRGQWE